MNIQKSQHFPSAHYNIFSTLKIYVHMNIVVNRYIILKIDIFVCLFVKILFDTTVLLFYYLNCLLWIIIIHKLNEDDCIKALFWFLRTDYCAEWLYFQAKCISLRIKKSMFNNGRWFIDVCCNSWSVSYPSWIQIVNSNYRTCWVLFCCNQAFKSSENLLQETFIVAPL